MHPLFERADMLSREVIGAAIEVHRIMGPGLLESIDERCLLRELELRKISAVNQRGVEISYKGEIFHEELKFDVLVDGCLLVEVKAVQEIHPIHKAQLLSYMKLLDVPLGLMVNFHETKLVDGISRMILRGADDRGFNHREPSAAQPQPKRPKNSTEKLTLLANPHRPIECRAATMLQSCRTFHAPGLRVAPSIQPSTPDRR